MPISYSQLTRLLPDRPNQEVVGERRESWQRAMTETRWPVASVYEVIRNDEGEDVVRGYGVSRDYYPMSYPTMPFELARVDFGDKDSALDFVHARGLLGFKMLLPESDRGQGGWYDDDPLEFIWVHAVTVRHVLKLYEALRQNEPSKLADAMKAVAEPTHFPDYGEDVPDHVRGAPWWANADGITIFNPRYWVPAFGDVAADPPVGYSPEEIAAETISDFISSNLSGIQSTVLVRDPAWKYGADGATDPPASMLSSVNLFDSLVQAVWWHLANFVTGGKDIAKCNECGDYFARTDKRQEFCPRPEWQVQEVKMRIRQRAVSVCGTRHRTRENRKKRDRGQ
jgi:hypothetical protein